MGDAASKLGTESGQVIKSPLESAYCLLVGWSGHGDYSSNSDRVGLKAVRSGNLANAGGFVNKEFHLVESYERGRFWLSCHWRCSKYQMNSALPFFGCRGYARW